MDAALTPETTMATPKRYYFTPCCSPCGVLETPARYLVTRTDGTHMPACAPCADIARGLGRPVGELKVEPVSLKDYLDVPTNEWAHVFGDAVR